MTHFPKSVQRTKYNILGTMSFWLAENFSLTPRKEEKDKDKQRNKVTKKGEAKANKTCRKKEESMKSAVPQQRKKEKKKAKLEDRDP